MMAKLGLHQSEPNWINPLNVAGARRLQLATEKYQDAFIPASNYRRSIASVVNSPTAKEGISPPNLNRSVSHMSYDDRGSKNPVMLEQIIHSDHLDADGQAHVSQGRDKKNLSSSLSPSHHKKGSTTGFKLQHK